jgi:hypothetical protein
LILKNLYLLKRIDISICQCYNSYIDQLVRQQKGGWAMAKLNCWEFKKCEREPGGVKTDELGVCKAATETRLDGTNGGKNGGRACWPIAGTLCDSTVQGTYAMKLKDCLKCDFYQLVRSEAEANLVSSKDILSKLK